VLCRVGVSGADVAGLEGFELLGCAEFVGLRGEGFSEEGREGRGRGGGSTIFGGMGGVFDGGSMVRNGMSKCEGIRLLAGFKLYVFRIQPCQHQYSTSLLRL